MTDQLATSEYTSPNARSTAIVAGTSRGVFLVTEAGAEPVLESGGVRDLFQLDGRIFAGTGDVLEVIFGFAGAVSPLLAAFSACAGCREAVLCGYGARCVLLLEI